MYREKGKRVLYVSYNCFQNKINVQSINYEKELLMKDVFIVGSKGIPANYGGFETFVDNLVTRQVNPKIKYHVSCMTFDKSVKQYDYNGAECQEIYVPNIGSKGYII